MDTDLSSAGASYLGTHEIECSGEVVARAGDVNNDGLDDILIGTLRNEEMGEEAGKVYLLLGKVSGWTLDTSLAAADASFLGEQEDDHAGYSISGAGDLDGDGLDDLLIGAPGASCLGYDWGETYVIFGKVTGWSPDTPLSAADASFCGELWDGGSVGSSVAIVGDVNADGFDDIVIGDPGAQEWWTSSGKAYLVLGRATGWSMDTDLAFADASYWPGYVGASLGDLVSAAGDVNADGFDDFLIGEGSATYLVLGKTAGWQVDTLAEDTDASFLLDASSIAAAGDVNGDGYDDFLLGDMHEAPQGAGEVYLFLGKASGWQHDTPVDQAEASFCGEEQQDNAGRAISGAGDVDGDGLDDLLIGAYHSDENGTFAGQAYLIFGRTTGWAQDTSLSTADVSFWGEVAEDHAGSAVAVLRDVNGDGLDDILIGAYANSEAMWYAGQTYVVFGHEVCVDVDGDGYGQGGTPDCDAGEEVDCDDFDFYVHPGAEEICNGVDDDCDPTTDEAVDDDGDGFTICDGDCDEFDPDVNPDALEECDGLDNDCDETTDEEVDGDGDTYAICDGDCDDEDYLVYLGAPELCDGLDNDCDELLPEDEEDLDGDTYLPCGLDCDDSNASVYEGATELCDGLDNDCDGIVDEDTGEDLDGDGYNACQGDCDDEDADVYPGGAELCDGKDNDCEGGLPGDEEDADGDGWMTCDGDCDDEDAHANPADADEDGWSTCDDPPDCADDNDMVSPGMDEDCLDGIDNNCDGLTDTADPECFGDDDDDSGDDDSGDDDSGDDDDSADDDTGEQGSCECRNSSTRSFPTAPIALLGLLAVVVLRRHRAC